MASSDLLRGLVYNPEHSSLLVFSSNCSASPHSNHQHNSDKDAEAVFSVMKGTGLVKDSMALLITTTMERSTGKGLKEAIGEQIPKVTSDDEGLFILFYCGGGCNLRDHGLALKVNEPDEEGFVVVESDESQYIHSLVLKDFDPKTPESHVSGGHLASFITDVQCSKPKQMLVILDCPCAEEIGADLQKHLKGRIRSELSLIISQGKNKVSHYLSPLGMSTFSYFFSKFLALESTGTKGSHATLYLKSIHSKVNVCCEAISSFRMVREDLTLTPSTVTPHGEFIRFIEDTNKVMEKIEQIEEDQVDGIEEESSNVGKFLQRYYKSGFFCRRVRLCNKAKDWAHDVMRGPMVQLMEQHELKDEVLRAVVGSMMASMATIQTELNQDCISNSNIFIQAYIYAFAAVSMHVQDLHIFDSALLKVALEFYMEVLHAKGLNETEVKRTMEM